MATTVEALKASRKGRLAHVAQIRNMISTSWNVINKLQCITWTTALEREMDKIQTINQEIANTYMQVRMGASGDDRAETEQQVDLLLEQHWITAGDNDVRVLELLAKLQMKSQALDPQPAATSTQQASLPPSRGEGSSLLGKITLQKYDGSAEGYQSFHDLFEVAVNKSKRFSLAEKMSYLITNLIGEAQDAMSGWTIADDHYEEAYQHFRRQFGDVEVRKRALLRKLEPSGPVQENDPESLRRFLQGFEAAARSLKILGVDVEQMKDSVKLKILDAAALPQRREWYRVKDNECKSVNELLQFLHQEVKIMQVGQEKEKVDTSDERSINECISGATLKSSVKKTTQSQESKSSPGKPRECPFGDGHHEPENCKKAKGLTVEQRAEIIRADKKCFRCLIGKHPARFCHQRTRCAICNLSFHHTLLHREQSKATASSTIKTESTTTSATANQDAANMLPTVKCYLQGVGVKAEVRGLLDNCSTHSYVSQELARACRFKIKDRVNVEISTFGSVKKLKVPAMVCEVQIQNQNGTWLPATVLALEELGIQQAPLRNNHPAIQAAREQGLYIKDTAKQGDEAEPLHFLLGNDVLRRVKTGKTIDLGNYSAMESTFGWTVFGSPRVYPGSTAATLFLKCNKLEQQVAAWFDTEDVPERTLETPLDVLSEQFKFVDARYEVPLLWKSDNRPANNKAQAYKIFAAQKERLEKNGTWDDYVAVVEDYKKFGALEDDNEEEEEAGHHLIHHAVLSKDSLTHRLRIVMNASKSSANGLSLNDCLEPGQNMMRNIFGILIQFREGPKAIIGDIEKAFFTVSVREEDRRFLKFAWVKPMRFARVPFGLSCSPFLLMATIDHHLKKLFEQEQISTMIRNKISNNIYVDDLAISLPEEVDVQDFKKRVQEVFTAAGMKVHKWRESGESSPTEDASVLSSSLKVLGLRWDPQQDELYFKIEPAKEQLNTKRRFLGYLSTIFDPLGILAPFTVTGKILLQEVWERNLEWDEEFPSEVIDKVKSWETTMTSLSGQTIPRHTPYLSSLDVYVDASEAAYAACIYAKGNLLCCKSKVAPLKKVTLARLELKAAVLGARLVQAVSAHLTTPSKSIRLFTDSRITLAWIQGGANKWSTFVGNRVATILRHSTKEQWFWLPGKSNLADKPSRGMGSSEEFQAWIKPPQVEDTGIQELLETDHELKIKTSTHAVKIQQSTGSEIFGSRFSSWSRTVNAVGWILRWRKTAQERKTLPKKITFRERVVAEKALIVVVQQEIFSDTDDPKKKGSQLHSLGAIKTKDKILRTGTRLQFCSTLTEDQKQPVILDHHHDLVRGLIREAHQDALHEGDLTVLASLRSRGFWILGGRKGVKSIRSKCVQCKRFDTRLPVIQREYAPLPKDRIHLVRPFWSVGIDYAGPVTLKGGQKAHLLLIVCSVTRALAVEITESVDFAEFLRAFTLFTAVHGRPRIVRSDNGATFVKASKELADIKWILNTPLAPWWGGFYEIFVRLTKRPLRKVLHRSLVTQQELQIIVARVVSVVNQRPITVIGNTPEDPEPITPAKLMGQFFPEVDSEGPDPDKVELKPQFVTKRVLYIKKLQRDIYARWYQEYLLQLRHLQIKAKGKTLREGEVVILSDQRLPRALWPLARVQTIIKGKDGETRSVRLKTAKGEYLRSVEQVIPLEITNSSELPEARQELVRSNAPADSNINAPVVADKTTDFNPGSILENGSDRQLEGLPGFPPKQTRYGRVIRSPRKFQD